MTQDKPIPMGNIDKRLNPKEDQLGSSNISIEKRPKNIINNEKKRAKVPITK